MEALLELFPSWPVFLAFASGALLLNLTPGVDMAFVTASSLGKSRRAGFFAAFGIFAGCMGHILFAVAGLSALLVASEAAFTFVKYLGAGYLLYLAVLALRTKDAPKGGTAIPESGWLVFRKGFLVNLSNPKVGMFFLAFLPQFTDPAKGRLALQILALGLYFNVQGLAVNALVAAGAALASRKVEASAAYRRAMRWVTASLFSALAVRLALTSRQ
ncbi:MAG TPA: LysE family translocator [Sphingomonadales bacterium]|nr:LysE family translocator [Sphingomonadales bacterium]